MNMLIGFRFMAGCWGVSPLTIGGGTVADIMIPEKRGAAMSIWALGPLFGPVIGPVAGGFLANAKGWRWYVAPNPCDNPLNAISIHCRLWEKMLCSMKLDGCRLMFVTGSFG